MNEALEAWFERRGWQPFDFQLESAAAWRAGEHGLIHAPTGTGKTVAAMLGPLEDALERGGAGQKQAPPLRVLWITPLRALAQDTAAGLRELLTDLDLPWTLDLRTGDTGSSARARQRRRLPSVLVTTPESLSLLLSYSDTQRQLAQVATVVVDEWHELLASKRGTLLELALARVRSLAPYARIWGLSATLANLDEALATLTGGAPNARLIRGEVPRALHIDSLRPAPGERFPWAGHLGTRMVQPVVEAIEASEGSTLLFTNTRSQAEHWFEALLRARPDWIETFALHHGSLDRNLRTRVEQWLRAGTLRCVVATSSLDLGVDFSPVARVIQVGSPRGVGRLIQRAGRSGHAPGRDSAILCVPTHALELLEIAAVRARAEAGTIEARPPLTGCLDVLAQHLVTLAAGGGFEPGPTLAEVRTTVAFAHLSDAEWQWTLDFIARGGDALKAYPEFRRVQEDADGRYTIPEKRHLQRHRMGIGTIVADAAMQVRFIGGGRLGTIEESFISRLKPGDVFGFAGRTLELARVRDLTAYVRIARRRRSTLPRWQGGRLPLSDELAGGMLERLADWAADREASPELNAIAPILDLQARWSRLPQPGELLIEDVRSREGRHLFFYPFAGRAVHEGLAALIAWRLSRRAKSTLRTAVNDYGFEVVGRGLDAPEDEAGLRALLDGDDLAGELEQCLNAGEMARREFRDIARIAGLVFEGYPGRGKSARQLQASTGLMFDVLGRHDPDNRLLDQARRAVFERQLDLDRLARALERIATEALVRRAPPRLTPFAFPLWAERIQHQVSSESWRERVERMAAQLERAAG